MTTFEKLLENYWFVKDLDEEQYNNIKSDITDDMQNFVKNKLGYKIIANPYVIKLEKIPGIGPKTAQRIILELQDKLKSEQELAKQDEQEEIRVVNNSENVEEAMQALQILGYNKKEIEKAFEKIANTDVSVEELIKKGLSILAR